MQVTGAPAGTPLTFDAVLHVTGSESGTTHIVGWVLEGATNVNRFTIDGAPSYVAPVRSIGCTARITVHVTAGAPFTLTTLLYGSASGGWAWLDGQLSFEGLPAGTRVTSCRGYSTPVAVPPGAIVPMLSLAAPAPNPAHGAFLVGATTSPLATATLTVCDVAGRVVDQRTLPAGATRRVVRLAVPGRPGIYLLRLVQQGRAVVRRIVVR